MLRTILYREWIKLRTVLLIVLSAEFCYAMYSCIKLKFFIRQITPVKVFGVISDNNYLFFDTLKMHFIILGLIVALLQFLPEMKNKTLKLTLHLPYDNAKMLFNMLKIGMSVLLLTSLFLTLIFLGITTWYYPRELVFAYFFNLLPWILSGIFSYALCSAICLEQRWPLRFLIIFVLYYASKTFIMQNAFFAYKEGIVYFLIITLVSLFVPYYSLRRFKEGK